MASINELSAADQALLSGQPASAPASTAPVATQPISTPAPQTVASPAAPAPVQASATPATTTVPTVQNAASSGQAEPAISDDQLLAAVGPVESPVQKASRLEREYSASSKEARRLSDYVKKVKESLEEQGISITEDDQKLPAGLLPTKKYSKEMGSLDIKFDELPENVRDLADADKQKFVNTIVERVKRAMTKVIPTTEQAPLPAVSPELHEATISYLAEAKRETGDLQFPGLTNNRKLVEQALNAPTTAQSVRDFYRHDPAAAIEYLHLKFEHARSFLRDQMIKAAQVAAAKLAAANANPTPAPTAGGAPSLAIPNPTGDPQIDAMNAAMEEIRTERK